MTSVLQGLSLSRSVRGVGENPGNEVADLEPKKTDKDERKEQFEDIENPSAEEILKRIKECCGEAVGKAFEGTNVAFIFSAGINGPECYKPSKFLSFLVFFYFLACFY